MSEAGGLGSLPCATLTPEQIRAELDLIRRGTARPCNVNFFCHTPPEPDAAREAAWKARLTPAPTVAFQICRFWMLSSYRNAVVVL